MSTEHTPGLFPNEVYLSPTIALGTTLGREPRLTRQGHQLHIALWTEQDAELVLEVIPIPHHQLIALVLRHELVIIRAEEYERVGESEMKEADAR
jgi:hypothetical protein